MSPSPEPVNLRDLAVALRELQLEFGLAAISATMVSAADTLTLRFEGLSEPAIGTIENRAGTMITIPAGFLG